MPTLSNPLSLSLLALTLAATASAQLIPPPAIPPKPASANKKKQPKEDIEWLWQYSPPPAEGREHELIQDPHFRPFLEQYFTAPQSFWGPESPRKSLPDTIESFLAVPNKVVQDEQRYLTATGCVFHLCASRGLLFADLNSPHPLVVFAAVEWIRDARPTTDPEAEYTLWIFPNHTPGTQENPQALPPPVVRSLTRWMAEPVARTGIHQKITHAILVDPDGTPHQVPVPTAGTTLAPEEAAPLTKRR
jgi:hypothetical protein